MGDSTLNTFERQIAAAREGNADAVGGILVRYRDYLKLLARLQLGNQIQVKMSDSDVIQETFVQAERNFAGFRGTTEAELLAWLRAILAMQIAQQIRFYHRDRRNVNLERQLQQDLDRSSVGLVQTLVDPQTSPSMRASRNESQVIMAKALAGLKPEHREVIVLRNLEEQSFASVAERIGRSVAATKSLWVRALGSLRRQLAADNEECTSELNG